MTEGYFPRLRERLPPERRYIVPEVVDDSIYFETNYEPRYAERLWAGVAAPVMISYRCRCVAGGRRPSAGRRRKPSALRASFNSI